MNIKGFKIKNQRIQKIWISVATALIVAIILIVVAFFLVFKKSSEISWNKEDLFNYNTYYTKYNITVYSNKNQNTYCMEEYCSKDGDEYKFRFNTNNVDANYSYIVTNDSFHIKSESEISEFKNDFKLVENTNVMSLATFLDIYLKIDNITKNNTFNKGIEISVEEKDDKISYLVELKNGVNNYNEMNVYKEAMVNGMKISKLQLIVDKNSYKPLQYIVFLDNGNAYVDIIYDEFKINAKFDEKVFSF